MAKIAVILLAAGSGARLGAGCAKALVRVGGKPLVRWAAESLSGLPGLTRLVLVVPAGEEGRQLEESLAGLGVEVIVTEGGVRRRDSVACGLAAAGDPELVLVHDAARAFLTSELASRVLERAAAVGAAVPAMPVADTLVREEQGMVSGTIPREDARAIQTPQGFRFDLLRRAHAVCDPAWDASDDGSMVLKLGAELALVRGEPSNFKVTWPEDLERAEALLRARGLGEEQMRTRVGLGWDLHPLVEGRTFHLVGVEVSSQFGPEGHSDGDPLSHAVADAMLGAAGLGDIGTHFPDTDPACKGISGPRLLGETVTKVAAAGWKAVQVDAVLITDRPKIAPHREAIRRALAGILETQEDAVSVKGKRTEGLGSLAGGAGCCCQCVVTLVRL